MAKKAGTTVKQGGIKSWMSHLFTKGNKKKANNVGVTTKARPIIDSLSEKNTTGSMSIVRSTSSTTTATTTTTRASSVHINNNNNKVAVTHQPTPSKKQEPVEDENKVPEPIVSMEAPTTDGNEKNNILHSVKEDQQLPGDIPAPIEVFWKHGGQDVYVTGTFDDWSKSVRMEKQTDGIFVAQLRPSDHTMWYKFVVDGVWKYDGSRPIEKDKDGNTNNVIHSI